MQQTTQQLALNLARSGDPASSHFAAETITKSGSRASMKAQVLAAVREWPGFSSADLAYLADLPHKSVHKRLPDLRNDGLAKSVKNGNRDLVWFVTTEGAGEPCTTR